MKLLVVCQYYYPEQFRINDICEQLVKDGHSVTVLTGLPNYPSGKIPSEYRYGRRRHESINGVNVCRCFEIGRGSGKVGLALNYLSYMLSASFRAAIMSKDFDLVFVYQLSPVTMALPGVIMKKRIKKPLFLYCCDIWPESMKIYIANESNIAYKMTKKISNYIYKQCDTISVTSKPFIKYFQDEHGIAPDSISYIPQHAENIELKSSSSSVNDIVDFVFMGNIGIAQDVECILNAAEQIKMLSDFRIHFVGDGSNLDSCKRAVERKGLQNIVVFHGRHPVEKMPEFYALADACLLTLKSNTLIGQTIPSKLQGYMAAGKPVIAAINGAAREVIHDAQCGVCVDAGDFQSLAECMRDFIEQPDKYRNCGQNARLYFDKHFTKESFMNRLENEFLQLRRAAYNVL